MPRTVTFMGAPLTLAGRSISTGMSAPGFHAVDGALKDVALADFKNKVKVINVFPSLDTPVCDLQVKEFNKRAAALSENVVVIGISRDLPFAQKRFCDAHDISGEILLSDYRAGSFGANYGFLIKELNLLARGAVIIDASDVIRYVQVVTEITSAVNFADVSGNLEAVLKAPSLGSVGPRGRCKPCEGVSAAAAAVSAAQAAKLAASHAGWQLVEGKKLAKEFAFSDFAGAKFLADIIAAVAQEQGHHPVLAISYGKLKVTLTTHAAGGLTENDFIMAGIIDEVAA